MRRPTNLPALLVCGSVLLAARAAWPCTNILITPGASADGATMITYAADSHTLYGALEFRPARNASPGARRKIFDWDSNKFLGTIPEVRRTYRVVGHLNEHQLVIAETTFTGREELKNPRGLVDYGSLMFIALERAKTAREAIKIMTDLLDEHGYASTGESFSIGDPQEAWILELIGMGPGRKGAAWVACRVPDGQISAHANQARIGRFPQRDPERCVFGKQTIPFARERGFFKGQDADFDFAAAYDPPTYTGLRFCEARVWNVFRRAAPSRKIPLDHVKGVEGAKPLPLGVVPDEKLAVADAMRLMRDHFSGTPFDMTKDLGAGPYRLPYRWRPLTWTADGKKYFNERAISTQQTGFSFVSQSRRWLPPEIGGVLWFGVDDTASTVYVPMYAGITRAPRPFAAETASFSRFSWDSAFWVFNFVANLAYLRYQDAIADVRRVQVELEARMLTDQPVLEQAALRLHARSPAAAQRLLTSTSSELAERTTTRWRSLGEALLMKYLDGNVRDAAGKVTHPGYPAEWYRRIARERGEHLLVRRIKGEPPEKPAAQQPAAKPAAKPAAQPAAKPAAKPTAKPAPRRR